MYWHTKLYTNFGNFNYNNIFNRHYYTRWSKEKFQSLSDMFTRIIRDEQCPSGSSKKRAANGLTMMPCNF